MTAVERKNATRNTTDVKPNRDRSNYRFIRRRTHIDAKPPPWYVIDLLTDTVATGTEAAGYRDEEAARQAQFVCNKTFGAWR